MKRKASLTLLETMVALGLLSLLLSSLFIWYRHLTVAHHAADKIRWPVMEEKYAHQRLTKLFSHITLSTNTQKPQPRFFFTSDHSLIFTFDNGTHTQPLLSSTVMGRLYFDAPSQTLSLGIWPLIFGTKEPSRTLPILRNVSACEMSFYFPPSYTGLAVDPGEVGSPLPLTGWQNTWRSEYETLPALVKLELMHEKRPLTLVFEVPQADHMITYVEAS